MRLSVTRHLLFISGIALGSLFLWSWSWQPYASNIRIESFNNRRSLSLESFQSQGEQKSPAKNQWIESTLELASAQRSIARASEDTRKTMPGTPKGIQSPIGRNLIAQKYSPESGPQTRILLMSYMRAGSTFTGDLFQFNPDVMYFYEPLLYTNDVDVLTKQMPVRNRLIPRFAAHPNPPETQSLLESILHCRLTVSNMEFIVGLSYSQSLKDFQICKSSPQRNTIEQCVIDLTKRCTESKHVVAKVLRLKMWEVEELMSRDPKLKVIYLVRDPRGIALSRRVASYFLQVDSLCKRMTSDANLGLELQKKYPGRLLTVRYEDLAMYPLAVTKALYQFAGIDWTDVIANRVQNITSPRDTTFQEHIFATKRKNSTATAFNWRFKLDFRSTLNVQNYCNRPMSLYGYKHFKTDLEMKDLRIKSIDERYNDILLKVDPTEKNKIHNNT